MAGGTAPNVAATKGYAPGFQVAAAALIAGAVSSFFLVQSGKKPAPPA